MDKTVFSISELSTTTLSPKGNEDAIRKALAQILGSPLMVRSRRLADLLTFVVEKVLHGEADHLKETTIGVWLFGRVPDYDPKVDTIVRSEAWRLRAKLKEYYAGEGSSDAVIIDLPRGHYIPVFHVNDRVKDEIGERRAV